MLNFMPPLHALGHHKSAAPLLVTNKLTHKGWVDTDYYGYYGWYSRSVNFANTEWDEFTVWFNGKFDGHCSVDEKAGHNIKKYILSTPSSTEEAFLSRSIWPAFSYSCYWNPEIWLLCHALDRVALENNCLFFVAYCKYELDSKANLSIRHRWQSAQGP